LHAHLCTPHRSAPPAAGGSGRQLNTISLLVGLKVSWPEGESA
jgi:hypothetical protein